MCGGGGGDVCPGAGRPTAWPEQSQVVVETVTKTSTTQKFAAASVQQVRDESDATKVTAVGPGLQHATANKEATFTVDTSHGGTPFSTVPLHTITASHFMLIIVYTTFYL